MMRTIQCPDSTRGSAMTVLTALVALAAIGIGVWYALFRDAGNGDAEVALTPPVTRGPMRVTISESGSLEALDSHNVLNKVEGRTTIDYIIPEGTVLTEEDVRNGTVLVRLNTADIEEKRIRQEIEVAAAVDGYANAKTNLEIQLHQNASDLRKSRLDIHFAQIDLERYVGQTFAAKLLETYASNGSVSSTKKPEPPAAGDGNGAAAHDEDDTGLASRGLRRLIASLLESEGLDGEALQSIRDLTSDIHLRTEELGRAQEKMAQSEKLRKKGYISEREFENDKLAFMRAEIAEDQAKTGRDQFVDYDFPKQVAQLISAVIEAQDGLLRAKKRADANEAQKRSALVSRSKQKELKERRLADFIRQEKECIIRATVPGLVVYASSGKERHWGNQERISEGATVRQDQKLISIPSPRSLGAKISVHETFVDRVEPGQRAWITVDAMPGARLPAVVKSVSRLPDPADRWLNPDLKVYKTILEFEGAQPKLKPGMSAEVEILITRLENALAVPVQAVAGTVEKPAVYVWTDAGPTRKPVTLGLASEHFVEIKSGLEAGVRLLLDPPREKRAAPTRTKRGKPDGKGRDGAPRGDSKRKGEGGEAKPRKERGHKPTGDGGSEGGSKPKGRSDSR